MQTMDATRAQLIIAILANRLKVRLMRGKDGQVVVKRINFYPNAPLAAVRDFRQLIEGTLAAAGIQTEVQAYIEQHLNGGSSVVCVIVSARGQA